MTGLLSQRGGVAIRNKRAAWADSIAALTQAP